MIKTFALIATLYGQSYVADTGLTYEDCMQDVARVSEVEIIDGLFVDVRRDQLSCEAE